MNGLDLLVHWKRPPCPATSEDGRPCALGIDHSACHVWERETEEAEVERLRRELRGAVRALEAIAALSDLHPGDWPTVGRRAVSKANHALGRPGGSNASAS